MESQIRRGKLRSRGVIDRSGAVAVRASDSVAVARADAPKQVSQRTAVGSRTSDGVGHTPIRAGRETIRD